MKSLLTLVLLCGVSSLLAQEYSKQAFPGFNSRAFSIIENDAVVVGGLKFATPPIGLSAFTAMVDRDGSMVGTPRITNRIQPSGFSLVSARWGGGYHWLTDEMGGGSGGNAFAVYTFGPAGEGLATDAYQSGGSFVHIENLVSLSNGNIAATGDYVQFSTNETYGLIIRMDASGNLVSARGFSGAFGSSISLRGGVLAGDGGVVYLGSAYPSGNETNGYFYLVKIDEDGALVWSWSCPATRAVAQNVADMNNLVIDANGDIWVLAYLEELTAKRTLIKVSPEGVVRFAANYQVSGFDRSRDNDILLDENGDILLLQSSFNPTNDDFIWSNNVCRLDADGNVLQGLTIEKGGTRYETFQRSLEQPGYIFIGNNYYCDSTSNDGVVVTRLDENFSYGDQNCYLSEAVNIERVPVVLNTVSSGSLTDLPFVQISANEFLPYSLESIDLTCPKFELMVIDSFELACNIESLSTTFFSDICVSRNGRNIESFTLNIDSPFDQGVLYLPPGFPVITQGNGTSELTIITEYVVTEAEFTTIVRAVEYQAPDWPTMEGEHVIHVSYVWACGELNDFDQFFQVTSPPIFPGVNAGTDTTVCFPATLSLTVASPVGTNFIWSTGDTSRIISVTEPGNYAVTVSNFCGADSAFFRIIANEDPPLTNESYSFELCPEDSITFSPPDPVNTTAVWDDGPVGTERVFSAPGTYSLRQANTCSMGVTVVSITSLPIPPAFNSREDVSYCPGANAQLMVPFFPATDYRWSTGASGTEITALAEGQYFVVAENVCGRDSQRFNVTISTDPPLVDLREDFRLCLGDSLRFRPEDDGARTYRWENDDPNPWRTFRTAGDYRVTRSNQCHSATTRVTVSLVNCCKVYLPTAFSPNGDGINDRFEAYPNPQYCPAEPAMLRVYDRWGGEVFNGSGITGWDGRDASGMPLGQGVYAYIFIYNDGERTVQEAGMVTLQQ